MGTLVTTAHPSVHTVATELGVSASRAKRLVKLMDTIAGGREVTHLPRSQGAKKKAGKKKKK